jgi:hypothetical protein
MTVTNSITPPQPDLEAIPLDHVDAVSDEMRAIIERRWPHLLGKLPPLA